MKRTALRTLEKIPYEGSILQEYEYTTAQTNELFLNGKQIDEYKFLGTQGVPFLDDIFMEAFLTISREKLHNAVEEALSRDEHDIWGLTKMEFFEEAMEDAERMMPYHHDPNGPEVEENTEATLHKWKLSFLRGPDELVHAPIQEVW